MTGNVAHFVITCHSTGDKHVALGELGSDINVALTANRLTSVSKSVQLRLDCQGL